MADRGLPEAQVYDMVILSDSDEEPDFMRDRDMVFLPGPAIEAAPAVAEEEPMEDEVDEDPEEDLEWDQEAADHDAAILMEEEMGDAEVPIEEVPEPEYDPAWDEPAPELEDIVEGDGDDAEAEDVWEGAADPGEEMDTDVFIELVQKAVADAEAAHVIMQQHEDVYRAKLEAAEMVREQQAAAYEARISQLENVLERERTRCDRLVTSLQAARVVRDFWQGRVDRLAREFRDSFRGLLGQVRRFPYLTGLPPFAISRGVVEDMIGEAEQQAVGLY